jgi:anti-anti-sigma regulatory factor
MGIQNLSEHVLLITLSREPEPGDEGEVEMRLAGERADCDVIVDLSPVKIMSSGVLCNLIVLERMLSAADRRLILCSMPPDIVGIFIRVGLQRLFQFADDQPGALQALGGDTPLYS